MNTSTYKLTVVFLTPILGSQPNRNVASDFIAKRAGLESLPEDEDLSLPESLERGTTVFHRNDKDQPVLFDYMLKGFLKNAGSIHNGQDGVRALKSKVNNLVFISPRTLVLNLPPHTEITYLERPLRAETAQGPRVALARSEMLPEGTAFTAGITVLGDTITEELLRSLLDYGYYMGLGQWRNGSWGQFRYELVKE